MIDETYFDTRLRGATDRLHGREVLLGSMHAETTDFVRFNHAKVRQAGTVDQASMSLNLIDGRRQARASVALGGDPVVDDARLASMVDSLRAQIAVVPEDPYLAINETPTSTHHRVDRGLPAGDDAIATITDRAESHDLVGIYVAGKVASAFGNSLGQRNWHETATFNFDWTLYLEADKAVKSDYSGFEWNDTTFGAKLDEAALKLDALSRPARRLEPGEYRAFLSPAALGEILGLLSYEAFGIRTQRTSRSSLMRLAGGAASLAPAVRISEHTAAGIAPNFQEQGWLRPDEVVLVHDGVLGEPLVSPRSAVEYGVANNGASSYEAPESLAVSGGGLAEAESLQALGTGLHIANLWYTNFSDLPACRVTGMTRFATFWVEGGEIVAPVEVLRFDDSVFDLLGTNLIDLTAEPEFIAENVTYGQRESQSMTLPGALVESMRFTL